jgi:hypothetical protein
MSFGSIQAEKMTTESGYSLGAGNASSFKNRIINGAMAIDQRNAGAAVSTGYPVDRFRVDSNVGSKSSQQQNAGGLTGTSLPSGFRNYVGCTSSGTYSVAAGDIYVFDQPIEGYNIADLNWGFSNAQPVTLSFWVRSSLTGTFGGSLSNSGVTRSYPFIYTINSANTWEQKSITIAGDTSGTWNVTNGLGVLLCFSLATGSTSSGTAGAWAGAAYYSATGAQSPMATSGATWYITGVQFEVGTVATSFDFRSYGQELLLCQRYFELTASAANSWLLGTTNSVSGYEWDYVMSFLVQKRVNPTGVVVGSWAYNNTNAVNSYIANSSTVGFNYIQIATGTGRIYSYNTGGGYITWSAEL